MNALQRLHHLGQSVWLDNIRRELLTSGTLAKWIREWSVTGLTSNPTIFEQAISHGTDYDAAIRQHATAGRSPQDVFFAIALEDITGAADLFRPVYDHSGGADGFVSLEVSPTLADDAEGTIAEAKQPVVGVVVYDDERTQYVEAAKKAGHHGLVFCVGSVDELLSEMDEAVAFHKQSL